MSARTELGQLLTETLPSFDVVDHYQVPDNLDSEASGGKPRLVLWRDTITPGQTMGLRGHSFVVWLLVPGTDPELVDDKLDQAVETLLNMLELGPAGYSRVGWTEAQRAVWQDAYPGYRVTLTFQTNKLGS
jgi:hypothetical protein